MTKNNILQPCVTFNKVNTNQWYKEHIFEVPKTYDATNKVEAFAMSLKWGEEEGIPVGILYQEERPTFMSTFEFLKTDNLSKVSRSPLDLEPLLKEMTLGSKL